MVMLWKNPIFTRFRRSQLRMKRAVFWYLLVLIASAFSVAIIYVPQVVRDRDPVDAARNALLPLLIIQGFVLLFMGTGSVASGITRDKVENVLNYHRLTPLPIHQKILGYLFGLPVREYVLFAITLPFLAFVLIVGRIGPDAFLPYYLIFFSSTLLYHLTGMVAGMISKRWRLSARISQGLIILLYFVLPQLSHIGLVFLEFLTVRPVFAEKILPVIGKGMHMDDNSLAMLTGRPVPFFTANISGSYFSFIIQTFLIILFTVIVSRKWKADTIQAFSKRMAVSTFLVFCIMSLGNVWPNLTRSDNALAIFQSDGDLPVAAAIFGLPVILAMITTMLGFVLLASALPDPVQYRQGRIRARRFNRRKLGNWEDAASGYVLTVFFFLIQTTLLVVALATLNRAGYFDNIDSSPYRGIFLILCTGLILVYFLGLIENFGSGKLGLFVLLHWMVPVLSAILIVAINQELSGTAILVASTSPPVLILLGGMMLAPPETFSEFTGEIHRGLGFGIFLMAVLSIWLHVRIQYSRRSQFPRENDEAGCDPEN